MGTVGAVEQCFQKLTNAGQDESRSLRCIYTILTKVLGKEKAAAFATLVMYPPPHQALVNEIYLENGKSLHISKEQRRAMIWSRLERQGTRLRFPGFSTIILDDGTRTRHDPAEIAVVGDSKTVVGLTPMMVGQDDRAYRVLPQHLNGDYSTWTTMQDQFSYPCALFPVNSDILKQMQHYMDSTPGYCPPSEKLHMSELLEHYYLSFNPQTKKRKIEIPPLSEEQKKAAKRICANLRKEEYQKAFSGLEAYCNQNSVTSRLLRACKQPMDKEFMLLLDGCYFRVRTEDFPQCKFYTNQNFLKPRCPSRWNVAIIAKKLLQPAFASGVWMPDTAVVLSRSKQCLLPQIQVWSLGGFMEPDRLWCIWKKYSQYAETRQSNITQQEQKLFGVAIRLLASLVYGKTKRNTWLKTCSINNQISFLVKVWDQYVETNVKK